MDKSLDAKSKAFRKGLVRDEKQAPVDDRVDSFNSDASVAAKPSAKKSLVDGVKHGLHRMGTVHLDAALSEDDILGDIAKGRQKFRQAEITRHSLRRAGYYGKEIGKFAVSKSYGLGNRTFNLVRGRGFTRTPEEFSKPHQAMRYLQNLVEKVRQSAPGKITRGGWKVTKKVTKPARIILSNPLATKSIVIMAVFVVIIAGIVGGSTPMRQKEFALNRSWLHLSQIDRKRSNDEVDYWSDLSDILAYTNYVYGDYDQETVSDGNALKRRTSFLGTNKKRYTDKTMADQETALWNLLYSDKNELKKMEQFYKPDSGTVWAFSEKEHKDYKEILERSDQTGLFITYQELGNFLAATDDKVGQSNALTIIKRFGYVSKDKVYNGTTFQATQGQTIYAPMSGTVEIKESDVIIKNDKAEFTFKKVTGLRYKAGEKVTKGLELAKVGEAQSQEVYYRKLEKKATKDKEAVWTYVNPGFYFPKVTYSQTTSVISDLNISGDLASRAKSAYDYIKKKIPNATDNGIAAMLGNYATESNIQPKRAESDYMDPPIGATDSSWDDENWLNMGYAEGASVGSLVVHRGLGLGQWTDTTDGSIRSTLLRNFAKSKGKKWYDFELQIEFMLEGDNPYYQQIAREILTSNDSVDVLTKRFLVNWEGNPGDKLKERQNNAQQMLTYFKQGTSLSSGTGTGVLASSYEIPAGYEGKFTPPSTAAMTTQPGNNYPVGQCTWYVANRLVETGKVGNALSSNNGNGQDWTKSLMAKGWKYSTTPTVGAVVSTVGGFDFTMSAYGHVAYVEVVNPDGSFLVSECNYNGVQDKIHYRVCQPAPYYSFASND